MANKRFSDVSVEYLSSEGKVTNLSGNPYPQGTAFYGEDAFLFLACLNDADKKAFEAKCLGDLGVTKTSLRLSFPPLEDEVLEFPLGKMNFGGDAFDISDGLSTYLRTYSAQLPNSFREDASSYLKEHPEISEFLHREPKFLYSYLVPTEEDLSICQKKHLAAHVLQNDSPKMQQALILPAVRKYNSINYRHDYLREASFVDDVPSDQPKGVAFIQSFLAPHEIAFLNKNSYAWNGKAMGEVHLHPVVMQKELEDIRSLSERIEYRFQTKPFRMLPESGLRLGDDRIVKGTRGAFMFLAAVDADRDAQQQNAHQGCYRPGEGDLQHASLSVDGTKLLDKTYVVGSGDLVQSLDGTYFPKLPEESRDIETKLQTAWSVLNRYSEPSNYYDVIDCYHPWKDDPQRHLLPLPTVEQSREKLLSMDYHKPEHHRRLEDKEDSYRYYLAWAECDPQNSTPFKVCRAAVLGMAEDGISQASIRGILKERAPEFPQAYSDCMATCLFKDMTIQKALQHAKKLKKASKIVAQ